MKLAAILTAFFLLFVILPSTVKAGENNESRRQYLIRLLLADCGSCHGLTLKGGLGPSLLAIDLAAKSDQLLFAAIRDGRPGTPMPPWSKFMTDKEISWLIEALRQEKWKE